MNILLAIGPTFVIRKVLVNTLNSNLLCAMTMMSKVFLNYFSTNLRRYYFLEVGRVVVNDIIIRYCFYTPEIDDGVSHLIKGKLRATIP